MGRNGELLALGTASLALLLGATGCAGEKSSGAEHNTCAAVDVGGWKAPPSELASELPYMAQRLGKTTPDMQAGRGGKAHCEPGIVAADMPAPPHYDVVSVTGVPANVGELCVLVGVDASGGVSSTGVYEDIGVLCPAPPQKL